MAAYLVIEWLKNGQKELKPPQLEAVGSTKVIAPNGREEGKTVLMQFKSRCLRKPGIRHGWGSADFLHFLAVFYFHSVMLKGNIFIFKHLIVFEIRPPPQKNRPLRTRNLVKFKCIASVTRRQITRYSNSTNFENLLFG